MTLPDGNVKDGVSWETTPLDIATAISKGLAGKAVVAKVRVRSARAFRSVPLHDGAARCPRSRVRAPQVAYTSRVGTSAGVVNAGLDEADASSGELWDLVRPLEGSCALQIITFDGTHPVGWLDTRGGVRR